MYTFNSETEALIKESINGKKNIKFNIGVMADKKTLFKTFGENGEIDFENNVYEIGSITKVFTTSLLAKNIFHGKLQLNDSINKYIPKLNSGKYYPSLKRIATHSSGYPGRYPLSYLRFLNLVIDHLFGKRKFKRIHPFGMDHNRMMYLIQKSRIIDKNYKWEYSNFGIALLGYIIGLISESDYWSTMNTYMVDDLGLKNSFLGTNDQINLKGFDQNNVSCGNWKYEYNDLMAPAGAISSTIEDLISFAKLNLFDKQKYFEISHQKYTDGSKWFDMGLGWWLDKNNNHIISHGGNTGCFCSFLVINKEKEIAVALLSNYQLKFGLPQRIGHMILNDLENGNKL